MKYLAIGVIVGCLVTLSIGAGRVGQVGRYQMEMAIDHDGDNMAYIMDTTNRDMWMVVIAGNMSVAQVKLERLDMDREEVIEGIVKKRAANGE